MGLTDRVQAALGALRGGVTYPLSLDDWAVQFLYAQNQYGVALNQTMAGNREEEIDGTYRGIVGQAYKRNGIVFACMLARMLLFSEARFQFQSFVKGRPGELYGTPELARLERPGPNQTTGDLLARMMQDADLSGNWFGARRGSRTKRLRPDWVTMVMGSESDPAIDARDIDAELIGLLYYPGGKHSGNLPDVLTTGQFAHYAPIPDPESPFRGMSWITPITREIMGDSAATSHKLTFFENAATPNMVVSLDKDIAGQAFKDFVTTMKETEPKGWDAYKTLYLGGGSTATVVGANLQQIDFKVVQGAGETRIAAASGVPAIIVGISEGLQGSSLNAGNYGMARRRFADLTMRPLWRNAAGSLESIVTVPPGSRLWYDDRDIPFLQEDVKDAADIQSVNSASIRSLVDAGFDPDSVVEAITANDLARLMGNHSGLFSVQLQPPQPEGPPQIEAPLPQALIPATTGQNATRSVDDVVGEFGWPAAPTLNLTFAEGSIRSDSPAITVNVPEQAPPVVNVTVPERNVEAAVVNVTVPEQPAPNVTVEAPQVTVNVPEQPAPQVTVEAPPPAEITVNVEQEPPVVNVNMPEQKSSRKTVKRDKAGRITEVTEE